jgi:hypothetical protein
VILSPPVVRRARITLPLDAQCRAVGFPKPETEFRFHPSRRWRFDYAWPSFLLAVEVDGGGFVSGRHSRGLGMEKDAEKFAEAAILGWTVLRSTPRQIQNGVVLTWIDRLRVERGWPATMVRK